MGDVGPIVMRDRETLGRDGFVSVLVLIDSETGELVEPPEVISRGFVFLRDASELIEMAQELIAEVVREHKRGSLTVAIQDALSKMFYSETKRRPMTFAFVREVSMAGERRLARCPAEAARSGLGRSQTWDATETFACSISLGTCRAHCMLGTSQARISDLWRRGV